MLNLKNNNLVISAKPKGLTVFKGTIIRGLIDFIRQSGMPPNLKDFLQNMVADLQHSFMRSSLGSAGVVSSIQANGCMVVEGMGVAP